MRAFICLLWAIWLTGPSKVQADMLDLTGLGGARYLLEITSLKQAKFEATTRQQFDFSCGSAALATLLTHHYNYPVTEQSVFEEMFNRGDQAKIRKEGFSLLDMKTYLGAHNFQGDAFELPLDKLLESGLPAIVLVSEKTYQHFVVIKGMRDGRILLGDPSSGTRAVSRRHFESVWTTRLLFVIHNQQDRAKFNAHADWRVAPRSPLGVAVGLGSLTQTSLTKLGPGDY